MLKTRSLWRRSAPLLVCLLPLRALAICGDGVHDADEACDDHGVVPGDGCSAQCQVEAGWVCTDADLASAFVDVLYDEADVRGGFHQAPEWEASSTKDQVRQVANAQASIYATNLPMSEVSVVIDVVVQDRQAGDHFGLTIGYGEGDHAAPDADWLLIDWSGGPYRSSQCKGPAGLSLSRGRGPITQLDDLWCHQGGLEEVARGSTLGATGWRPGQTYRIRVDYSRNQVRVVVNDSPEITQAGSFPAGNLGLYAFSQENVSFQLISPHARTICAGLDADEDSVADAIELRLGLNTSRADTDDDGVPDSAELGTVENPLDTDLDGILNALDRDDDGDGALTYEETWDGDRDPANDDTDRDGLPDFLDGDDDGDGLGSGTERYDGAASPIAQDTDQDGRPDMVDIDDDGDGVPTTRERVAIASVKLSPIPAGEAGAPEAEAAEAPSPRRRAAAPPAPVGPPDLDRDGVPDFRDADDDGDGVLTAAESYDGDRDPENDDTDRDGIPDYLDVDDDGDGLSTAEETLDTRGARDLDFDGRPDHVDMFLTLPDGVKVPEPAPPPVVEEEPEEEPTAAEVLSEALSGLTADNSPPSPTDAPAEGCAHGSAPLRHEGGLFGLFGLLALRRRVRP